jgi:hypothetical protein
MLPPAAVLVPLVPIADEVDPETFAPVVPFRFAPLVPSLLGLPLRLACELAVAVSLAVPLLWDAFERIHPPAVVVDALVPCDTPPPCMRHPVNVIGCAADDELEREVRVVADCPLRFVG